MSAYTVYYVEIKQKGYPTAVPYREKSGGIGYYKFPEAYDIANSALSHDEVEYTQLVKANTGCVMYRFYKEV